MKKKKRNPLVKDLRTPKYKHKIEPDKKKYSRKKKHNANISEAKENS